MAGTIRTHADQAAAHLRKRVQELAQHVAGQYGGRAEAQVRQGYGALLSNPLVAKRVRAAAATAGAVVVDPTAPPPMYAEDFAYYTREKPASFFFLGTKNEKKGFTAMTHNSDFDVDEEAMAWAARIFATFALENGRGIAGL
jgi:metal-dependent amidase/aminoacylase/carboxypeptidase family protein